MVSELHHWNQQIHAFTQICEAPVADDAGSSGALQGLAFGVKDIIDVAGLPTRNGSAAYADAAPSQQDAPVVAALRAAGAKLVGKTTTTEFAFTDPTDCRNPHDLSRSPGGSSSGSGAAVAAGLVDIALGTQTAGSLCRPAAYCGVVGFKPSYGLLCTEGVTPLAPSFDTVGIIAKTVALAERAFAVMRAQDQVAPPRDPSTCTVCPLLWDTETEVAAETQAGFQQATEAAMGIFAQAPTPEHDINIPGVIADHGMIMCREAFEAHGHLLADGRSELLQPNFRAALEAGSSFPAPEVQAARQRLSDARQRFWEAMQGIDAILTLAVPDGAPKIGATTGFQHWLTPWSVFGGPLVSLPWGLDGLGRPRSVMLAGHPQTDATLLKLAAMLAADAPSVPVPVLPV